MFNVSQCDAGDFCRRAVAWDVLNTTAQHQTSLPDGINMQHCLHLKPYSIACLASLGAKSPQQLPLIWPMDSNCRDHIARLGLHRWFQVGGAPNVALRDTNVPIEQLMMRPTDFASRAINLW